MLCQWSLFDTVCVCVCGVCVTTIPWVNLAADKLIFQTAGFNVSFRFSPNEMIYIIFHKNKNNVSKFLLRKFLPSILSIIFFNEIPQNL